MSLPAGGMKVVVVMRDPRNVVYRGAQHEHGNARAKAESAGCAVDRHQPGAALRQRLKIAVSDVHHPVLDAEPARVMRDEAPPAADLAIERVLLDDQHSALWRLVRETFQHIEHRIVHARERRMFPNLEIRIQLKREQKKWCIANSGQCFHIVFALEMRAHIFYGPA